jgi:hypothetical protein
MDTSTHLYYQTRPETTGIEQVLIQMQSSLYTLDLQCSYATQMKLIEETKHLPSLPKLHKQNYEGSYHRTTSIGCLYRLQKETWNPQVAGISISCMIKSREADLKSLDAVKQMKQEARSELAKHWVEIVERWLRLQLQHLEEAMRLMRQLVGEQMWHYAESLEY